MSTRRGNAAILGGNNKPGDSFTPDMKAFLLRSLNRNDVDLGALLQLNRTLHQTRESILACPNGELILLDLGEGKLKLKEEDTMNDVLIVNEEESDETRKEKSTEGDTDAKDADKENKKEKDFVWKTQLPPPPIQKLCVDFLLRMKLRRSLMNRLFRRLFRVAHALDGSDIHPPPTPRYGDLRLDLGDKGKLQTFMKEFEQKQWAIDTIRNAQEEYVYEATKVEEEPQKINPRPVRDAKKLKKLRKQIKPDEPDDEGEDEAMKGTTNDNATKGSSAEERKAADANGEVKKDSDVSGVAPDLTPSTVAEQKASNDSVDPKQKTLDACYNVLREYNDVYTKVLMPSGQIVFPALMEEREEDYKQIRHGVGAMHMTMSMTEKEAEFKRWKAGLLSRIPDQPTFEELGMNNRVFNLKERRQDALKKAKQEANAQAKLKREDETRLKKKSSPDAMQEDSDEESESQITEIKESSKEEEERMDVCDDDKKADGDEGDKMVVDDDKEDKNDEDERIGNDDNEKVSLPKRSAAESPSKDAKKKKEVEPTEEEAEVLPPVRIRPMSLQPIPSFYDQDLKRIKMLQLDLMGTALQTDIRRRIEAGTNDYNAGTWSFFSCHFVVLLLISHFCFMQLFPAPTSYTTVSCR